jgi:hypothetical protein
MSWEDQIPNSNLQIPNKRQTENDKTAKKTIRIVFSRLAVCSFAVWVLSFVWDLGFGAWDSWISTNAR